MRKLNPGERVYHFRAVVARIGPDTPNTAHHLAAKLKHQLRTFKAADQQALYPNVMVEPIDPPRRTLDDIKR